MPKNSSFDLLRAAGIVIALTSVYLFTVAFTMGQSELATSEKIALIEKSGLVIFLKDATGTPALTRQSLIEVKVVNNSSLPFDLNPMNTTVGFRLNDRDPLKGFNKTPDLIGRFSVPPVRSMDCENKFLLRSEESFVFSVRVSEISWIDGRSSYLSTELREPATLVIVGEHRLSLFISTGRTTPVTYENLQTIKTQSVEYESNSLLANFH